MFNTRSPFLSHHSIEKYFDILDKKIMYVVLVGGESGGGG